MSQLEVNIPDNEHREARLRRDGQDRPEDTIPIVRREVEDTDHSTGQRGDRGPPRAVGWERPTT
eukprot:7117419-Alexandrium_andersonii.AAC.1